MNRNVLRAKDVEAFKGDKSRRREVPDAAAPGLYLIVQPTGSKSWAYRYQFDGRPCKLTIGTVNTKESVNDQSERPPLGGYLTLAEARKVVEDQRHVLRSGRNPAPLKAVTIIENEQRKIEAEARLFKNVVEQYVAEKKVQGRRSAEQIEWIFKKYVTPRWSDLSIEKISRAHVTGLRDEILKTARIMSNRVFANVRGLFNWCLEEGIISESPAANVKPKGKEVERDRILTDHEIRVFWKACDKLPSAFGNLFKFLLVTGQRRDEAARATFSEFDFDDCIWTLERVRTKNKKAHVVPLSPLAVDLIRSITRIHGKPSYAFTSSGAAPVSGFSKAKAALDSAMQAQLPAGQKLEPWRLHDLRRTAASGFAKCGTLQEVNERILNHKSGKYGTLGAIYNRHDYLDEKRQALNAWSDRLQSIVSEESAPAQVSKADIAA